MVDSPIKKLNFDAAGKENVMVTSLVHEDEVTKSVLEIPKAEGKPAVAPTIKPEEADEPLLQENPHRFVLFPIKYHEVRAYILTRRA
jgi:ribonucleoside-diphosphate reductase subunit M2